MNHWLVWAEWFFAWFLLQTLEHRIYPKRVDRGYLARLMLRIWRSHWSILAGVIGLSWLIIGALRLVHVNADDYGFWLAMIIKVIDDVVNGDDGRWRRYRQAARNVIKWRMSLPAAGGTR